MAFWGQTTEKEQFHETELARPSLQQHSKDKEFVIALGLIVEGKIEGTGHVRIAGRFKGDIHMEGDVTVEQGLTLPEVFGLKISLSEEKWRETSTRHRGWGLRTSAC